MTVLVDALGFVVIHALAAPDGRKDLRHVVGTVRGHDARDGLAHHLRCRVAEEAVRTLVPAGHHAIEGLPDDGIVRELDDGGEVAVDLLRTLARRDVHHHADGAQRARACIPNDDSPGCQPAYLAVVAESAMLDVVISPSLECHLEGGFHPLAVVRVNVVPQVIDATEHHTR